MRSIPWPLILLVGIILEAAAYLVLFPHNNWFASGPGAQSTIADSITSSSQVVRIIIDSVAVIVGVVAVTYLALIWEIGRRNYVARTPKHPRKPAPVSGLVRPSEVQRMPKRGI
jgi:hypothetical protein